MVAWKLDTSSDAGPAMFASFDFFRLENAGRALACGDTMALRPIADFATSDGAAQTLDIPDIVARAAKPSVIWVFMELLSVVSLLIREPRPTRTCVTFNLGKTMSLAE
jgi:hypothetical protein